MRSTRGYTLMEMIVATGVGSLLTMTAVGFATNQTQALGVTNDQLELSQAARSALTRLKADLRMAGAGVGYNAAGQFAGLELGEFTRGTAVFDSTNHLIALGRGTTITDDIGISSANGDYATIAAYSPSGAGQLCAGQDIEEDDLLLFRSEDGLSARTMRISGLTPARCVLGQCSQGCEAFGWSADDAYLSGDDAMVASYAGGEAASGFKQLTWFVESTDPNDPGVGRLRRADGICDSRDHTCGDVMLENVESVQVRVYQRTRSGWIDRTELGARVSDRSRIRVDVELVIRSRHDRSKRALPAVEASLEPQLCFPACGTQDHHYRHIVRTTVEIKNSGRLQFKRRRR